MNDFKILGPPRGGRRVLSEKEALEEIAGYGSAEAPIVEVPSPGPVKPVGMLGSIENHIVQVSNDTFQFFDVPYQGGVLPCIERTLQYLDGGVKKTQEKHLEWLAEPANNPNGWTIADMELEYQMLRISFELRNHPALGAVASEYIKQIRELYDCWILTADYIEYSPGGLEAVITNKGNIPSKSEKRIQIPTYTEDHLVLSHRRLESQLDIIAINDQPTNDLLKSYLGHGFEQAGVVFSYCARRDRTRLRETRLWTPRAKFRTQSAQRVGGLNGLNYTRFSISTAYEVPLRGFALPVALKSIEAQ